MKKRGQVAMEFLMTYGWAIIIILLAIAALWLLGVFNFDSPTKCTMTAPFNCNDAVIFDNSVLLRIGVTQVQSASVTKVTVNGETCPTIIHPDLTSDIINTVICKGVALEDGQKASVEISANYRKKGGGFTQEVTGSVTGEARKGSYVYTNDPNLVAAYDFEDDLTDLSGNKHDGSLFKGAVCGKEGGVVGNACFFDGVDDYGNIPDDNALDFEPTQSFTIEFWTKYIGPSAGTNGLVEKWDGTPNSYPYVIRRQGPAGSENLIGWARYQNPASATIVSTTSLSDEKWHHIAAVKNGAIGRMELYIDGQFHASTTDSLAAPTSNNNPIYLGSRGGINSFFNGGIDELAIYNRALLGTEIVDHYERTK